MEDMYLISQPPNLPKDTQHPTLNRDPNIRQISTRRQHYTATLPVIDFLDCAFVADGHLEESLEVTWEISFPV